MTPAKVSFSLIVGLPLALAIPVLVEAAPHHRTGVILDYDQNADNRLAAEEFLQARRARFEMTDRNGNGVVDVDEYLYEYEGRLQANLAADRAAQVRQTHVRFGAINRDEDEKISLAEFEATGKRGFDYLDVDQDGVIRDGDKTPVWETSDDSEVENELVRRPTLSMPSTHSVEGMLEICDLDGDAQVQYEEYQEVRAEQFARADENSDGELSQQEYVLEFEDRLDAQISKIHEMHMDQTYVRFDFLDTDENAEMTFKEYMHSGNRSFNYWDTNGDGYVTLGDPLPGSELEAEFDSGDSDLENLVSDLETLVGDLETLVGDTRDGVAQNN